MGNLTFLLVALHTLFMIASAPSLQRYECTNAAGSFGGPKCTGDNAVKRTCDCLSYRCIMTMNCNYSFLIFQSTEIKNCRSSLACDLQFDFICCKKVEVPGPVSNCTLESQGDLCNGPSNSLVTSSLEVIASFSAILWAIILTMFMG